MSLISELRRREVLRSAFAYLAISWLLIQIVETILPVFGFGDAPVRLVVIVLAIGFLPVLILSWVFEWTPEGFKRDEGEELASVATGDQAKTWDRVIILILVLALSLFAFDRFVLSPSREAQLIAEATDAGVELERAKAAAIPEASVAVLPFINMSGDPQNEYFSDGLSETLLHMLAQLADLKVSARTSSFTFKGRSIDLREIAALLGVAHVLEGSVQKAANRVRITAQLIRASDGFHIWSRKYDRDLDDIFAIQDEIANDVAASIGSELLAANPDAITGVSTSNVDAFDLYLKALDQQAKHSVEGINSADALLREAIAVDPGFIDARVSLARNRFYMEYKVISKRGSEMAEAASLLTDILAQRPKDSIARSLLLMVRAENARLANNFPLWESLNNELFEFVLENSGDQLAVWSAIQLQNDPSRLDDSLALVSKALVEDPLNAELLEAQSTIYERAGRPEDALVPLLTAVKAQPENAIAYWRIAQLYLRLGNVAASLDWYRKAVDVDPQDVALFHWEIGGILYSLGFLAEGDYWLEELSGMNTEGAAVRTLEVFAAMAHNDADRVITLTAAFIADTMAGNLQPERGWLVNPRLYAYYMHAGGRSRQALEFLESMDPGKLDYSTPPDLLATILRGAALSLQAYTLHRDEFDAKVDAHLATLEAMGFRWRESNYTMMIYELWNNNDIDAARERFLAEFEGKKRLNFLEKMDVFNEPMLTEFLADPAVAERLADFAAEDDRQREAVRKMLRRPEWVARHADMNAVGT